MINQNLGKIYREYCGIVVNKDDYPTFYSYLSSKFDDGDWVTFAIRLGYKNVGLFAHEINICTLEDYNSLNYNIPLHLRK